MSPDSSKLRFVLILDVFPFWTQRRPLGLFLPSEGRRKSADFYR